MSDDVPPSKPGPLDLQFDRAEPKAAPAAGSPCASCGAPMTDLYHVLRGHRICSECARGFASESEPDAVRSRFLKAASFGLLASLVGGGAGVAVFLLLGPILGLVAIISGGLIGGAVRKGSEGRGGWPFQALAIGLTYLSLIIACIPVVYKSVEKTSGASNVLEIGLLAVYAPVLMLARSLFSIIFVLLGFYEAWKLTRRADMTVTGPFRIGGAPGA